MRLKHKKLFISGIAVTVAGVLGVGALLQTSVSVQASSAMMPGVEQIVNDATADKPFRILEIVDKTNEAEIGYYVSGQEPYIKLYNYTYTYKDENGEEHQKTIPINTLEEGLKKIASASQRKEFATNTKKDGSDTGIKNIQNISYQNDSSGEEKDYPLSYTPYEERYFLTSEQENSKEWTPITFEDAETEAGRTDTVKVKGKYQPNSDGTGDYTKQEQTYYPIRRDSETDKSSTEKYRENIQNFFFSDNGEANEPYFLEFEEVDNSSVNEAFDENNNKKNGNAILQEYDYTKGGYGYYENVYGNLTEEIVNNISNGSYLFPGETPQIDMSLAVKVPVESGNQTTNAKSFTDGTDDFSTIDEADTATQGTGQPGISADSDQFGSAAENAFSSGDFSDGDTGNVSDTGNADGAQMQDPDSAADADTGIDSGIATEADSGQTTVIENDKIQPLISYTQEIKGDTTKIDSSVGTSKNPKVYFGITTDQYPYYEYTLLSDMKKIVACAKRNKAEVENGTYTPDASDKEHNITFQDDQYWYWTIDQQGNITKNPIFVVTCRQPVSYDNVQKLPETLQYNYYYKVKQAYFCCKTDENDSENEHAYKYFGWYSPGYPKDEDIYLAVKDGKTATHYISAAEYKLTPKVGDYDFVPDDNEEETTVEVNHMYYRGGYTNHDWFKQYVFHLSQDDSDETVRKQFTNFNIEVVTMTADDFNKTYGNGTASTDMGNADTAAVADDGNAENNDRTDSEIGSDEGGIDTEPTAQQTDESETSEVDSMVSEAGVELVSIEKNATNNETEDFQDGTAEESQEESFSVDADQTPEVSEQTDAGQFSDNTSDDISTFSDGNAAVAQTNSELLEYGLIYVNGQVNSQGIRKMYDNLIPFIINTAKAGEGTTLGGAVASYTKEDDNGHYVNNFIYFFIDLMSENDSSSLVNINFNSNFNPDVEGDVTGNRDTVQGFEEVLEYIESENKYRRLGQENTAAATSEDSTDQIISDGAEQLSSGEIEPLKKNLSQARAIEYIINYKYKRVLKMKEDINVLEIEPAAVTDANKLSSTTVSKWLGKESRESQREDISKLTSSSMDNIENLLNGKDNVWRSNKTEKGNPHWVEFEFKEEKSINGFYYTAPGDVNTSKGQWENKNKGKDGVPFKLTFTFYDSNEKEIYSEIIPEWFSYGSIDTDKHKISFTKNIQNVKTVKIEFTGTYASNGNENNVGCYASAGQLGLIFHENSPVVTAMTASEFVGHIDDIGAKYDMIYIGSKKDTSLTNVDLLTGSGEMCYAHVGAGRGITLQNKNSNLLKLIGQLDIDYDNWTGQNGMRRFAPIDTYSEHGAGYYRGSGNDMTDQIRSELMKFVKSGYPVVIDSDLMSDDRTINTRKVDASSYYYQFLKEALSYDNVFTTSELNDNTESLNFFSNLAKPVIHFEEKPAEPPRANETNADRSLITNGELKYVFTIENDSDAAPAVTTYDCNLYFDLNFDGNLSEKESQDSYIEISDEDRNVLSQISDGNNKSHYELQAGQKYTLVRKLPESYFKIITWKLEITSNKNSYIHTSETGYAKQARGTGVDPQQIKVVQLQAFKNGNYWDLSDKDGKFQKMLKNLMEQYNFDFDIQINPVSVNTVNSYTDDQQMKNLLDQADMLIIGFTDGYDNISNAHKQVDAIVDFIKSGKSVLFSHDTTSYINYDQDKMYAYIADKKYDGTESTAIRTEDWNFKQWGLELNKVLRSIVGMDRYGITSDDKVETSAGIQMVSGLLKKGDELQNGNQISFNELIKVSGDIAYQSGNRNASYAQTQGYSNEYVNYPGYDSRVEKAQKVNDGAITQYPYVIGDEIKIAETHGQYYQLGLEQDRDINGNKDGKSDVVVWYTLTDDYYGVSPKDVRNNYYFYSKGNVIYTGAGHSGVSDDEEIQLFINAITAAANVTAVEPKASFVKSLNPGAETENVKYYMTDQATWSSPADTNIVNNGMKFYINIKDYNMVSSDLNQADLDKQEITMQFFIEKEDGEVQDGSVTNSRLHDITREIQNIKEYGGTSEGINVSDDGMFHTKKSNAFEFTVTEENLEKYLKDSQNNGYKNSCRIYAKISSTVYLYNKPNTRTVWTSVDLKQRQLFDLD